MDQRITAIGLLTLGLGACASTPSPDNTIADANVDKDTPPAPSFERVASPHFAGIAAAGSKQDKDRLAILAMQGEYRVTFDFQETVELKAGYERHEPKESGGYETVIVVRDEPGLVVMQHILVSPGGHVIKHWRQDWRYEAPERFVFVADQTWRAEPLGDELTAGAWTQCVYEVSDAPRYCGTGQWVHDDSASTWTSDWSWRPLPRREYTKRDDYNALYVINRHTITPQGWTHEQDNVKVVRDGEAVVDTLVREFGFNDYRNIEGFDFTPAYDYWDDTDEYWASVRQAWNSRLDQGQTLTLNTSVDGMVIIMDTFEQAENAADTSVAEERQNIENLLQEWTTVTPPGTESTAQAD